MATTKISLRSTPTLRLDIGEIDTTRVVYGTKKRFHGEVIGIPSREVLLGSPASG